MRLLLDTHAIIWWLDGDRRLSVRARHAIDEARTDAVVSVASVWETSIKQARGRLGGPNLADAVIHAGLPFIPIDEHHATLAGSLPLIHRDPFDRMLVAQAMIERLPIVTVDEHIAKYDVKVIW